MSDQPWVTGAETCELALALDAIGDRDAATGLVAAMQHLREPDGSYWTGLVLTDGVRWPVERTTWTAAAVVLAVDALHAAHPRSEIFRTPGVGAAASLAGGAAVLAATGLAASTLLGPPSREDD